jgi:transcriptional regulator with XRE-family HTH domain
MAEPSGLATFLRTRRDLLKPADVGLPDGDRRRVAGLRREEVAMLAGISTEYYLRLEQGRERGPSDQVLEGLARALQLDDDAVEYMRNLSHPAPRRRRRTAAERVDPGLEILIDNWHLTPAYVQGRRMTILAANPLARALNPRWTPGTNQLRAFFLEPDAIGLVRDWDGIGSILVSWLRFLVAQDSTDPELQSLVGELGIASQRFRTLWAGHNVKQKTTGPCLFDHPQVGPLDLVYRVFSLPEARQSLVAYYAQPGSPSEERLRLLSSLAHPVIDRT